MHTVPYAPATSHIDDALLQLLLLLLLFLRTTAAPIEHHLHALPVQHNAPSSPSPARVPRERPERAAAVSTPGADRPGVAEGPASGRNDRAAAATAASAVPIREAVAAVDADGTHDPNGQIVQG